METAREEKDGILNPRLSMREKPSAPLCLPLPGAPVALRVDHDRPPLHTEIEEDATTSILEEDATTTTPLTEDATTTTPLPEDDTTTTPLPCPPPPPPGTCDSFTECNGRGTCLPGGVCDCQYPFAGAHCRHCVAQRYGAPPPSKLLKLYRLTRTCPAALERTST